MIKVGQQPFDNGNDFSSPSLIPSIPDCTGWDGGGVELSAYSLPEHRLSQSVYGLCHSPVYPPFL